MPESSALLLKSLIIKLLQQNLPMLRDHIPDFITALISEECPSKPAELSVKLLHYCNDMQPIKLTNQMKLSPHGK